MTRAHDPRQVEKSEEGEDEAEAEGETMEIVVPEGVGAGDTLSVTTPDGEDSRGRVCHYVPILI